MADNSPEQLLELARGHGFSAQRLYGVALEEGKYRYPSNPYKFAFNGPYSLSTHYLLTLSLELMLKAAFVAWGGDRSDKSLKSMRHDLRECLCKANELGFITNAPMIDEVVRLLRDPYRLDSLRYRSRSKLRLPNIDVVINCLAVLDDEVASAINASAL